MRGIGKGQRVTLITPPEVSKLVKIELSAGRGVAVDGQSEIQSGNSAQDLRDVISWLLLNGMKSEQTQANMLICQNVANVWKKSAYRAMLKLDDSRLLSGGSKESKLSTLLSAWKEETDTSIPNCITNSLSLKSRLDKLVTEKKVCGLLNDKDDMHRIDSILASEFRNDSPLGSDDNNATSLESEQVQEQEQEQVISFWHNVKFFVDTNSCENSGARTRARN
jgi:hypothetical protein